MKLNSCNLCRSYPNDHEKSVLVEMLLLTQATHNQIQLPHPTIHEIQDPVFVN